MEKSERIEEIMLAAPVIPVVTVDNVDQAVSLAKALVAGGLPAIEVTLRTPNALEIIRAIASDVEGAICGAGTVITPRQVALVGKAGAKFMVSPGFSPVLLESAKDSDVPLLPGIASPSQAMYLGEAGYEHLKFFPAGPAGGPSYLKALGAPLPQFKFCPTGGVNLANAQSYLELENVLCVGGSWVAPSDAIESGNWDAIEILAREAAGLGMNTE